MESGPPQMAEDGARVRSREMGHGAGATVVFFGGCAPGTTVTIDTRRAHYEELSLLGAFHHTPESIRLAVELLETEALVPDPLLTHAMGLEAVPAALGLMARGEALKVLIEPQACGDRR